MSDVLQGALVDEPHVFPCACDACPCLRPVEAPGVVCDLCACGLCEERVDLGGSD